MSSPLPRPSVADRGLVLLITLLCTAITVAAAGTSLWLRTSADDMTGASFRDADPLATQLRVTYVETADRTIPDGTGEVVDAALAPTMRAAYDPPRHVAGTTEMVPKALPARSGEPAFLSVAGFPRTEELVEIVQGRMPRPGAPVRPLPTEAAAAYDGPARSPVVEVVLEVSAAMEMDLPIGTWVEMTGARYQPDPVPPPVLHVVGTYRAADAYPSPLDDVDTARKPSISVQPEFNLVRATALAADDATVLGADWLDRPDVRWTFDLSRTPGADEVDALVEEARRAELQAWPPVLEAGDVGATTGLGDVAAEAASERRTSDGLVALVVASLAAGALAILLAAAHVLAVRREDVTAVVRARGASGRWLVGLRGGEAALLATPGVVVALAVLAVAGRGIALRDVAVAVGAGLMCALLITAAQTFPRLPGGDQLRAVLHDSVQLVLVVLAAGATALVLLGDRREPDDPVVLLLPPLLGAAAAVVLVRLLQVGLGGLRRLARRTRGAAPVVSLSQTADVARQVVIAVAALVLAVAAGFLGLAVADTVEVGAERTGWEQVGADVSVLTSGVHDDTADRVADVPGVTEVAAVFTSDSVSVDTRTGVEGVQLVATDPAALAAVGDERLRGVRLPPAGDGTLSAVASSDLVLDGDTATLLYAQSRVTLEVVDRLDRIPGVTEGGSFVLVDLAALERATDRRLDSYDTLLLQGAPDRDEVEQVARAVDPQAVVRTRDALARAQLESPAVVRTRALLPLAIAAAGTLAVFAVVLVVGLGRPAGRRTSHVLTAVGADARQRRRVHVLALLPVVVGGGLVAALCGLLLTRIAGAGFDLATLTATRSTLDVRPGAWSTVALAGFLVGLVLLAVLAGRPGPSPDSDSHEERR